MPKSPLEWLKGAAFAAALYLSIPGKPLPAPRPRFSRNGHAYKPQTYTDWRTAAQSALASSIPPTPIDGPVTVAIMVRGPKPKKTVLEFPRGDTDNYAKSVLDLLTSIKVWLDDTQVGTLLVRKRWENDDNPPGFTVWVAPEQVLATD